MQPQCAFVLIANGGKGFLVFGVKDTITKPSITSCSSPVRQLNNTFGDFLNALPMVDA
jgi:hypothetical protein